MSGKTIRKIIGLWGLHPCLLIVSTYMWSAIRNLRGVKLTFVFNNGIEDEEEEEKEEA